MHAQKRDIMDDRRLKVFEVVINNVGATPAFIDLFDSVNIKKPIITPTSTSYTYTVETPAVAFNASSRAWTIRKGFIYRIDGDRVLFTNQIANHDTELYQSGAPLDYLDSDGENRLYAVSNAGNFIEIRNIDTAALIGFVFTAVGENPTIIKVDPSRNQYYVYLDGINSLRVYDLTTNAIISTTALIGIGTINDMAICGDNVVLISTTDVQRYSINTLATAVIDSVVFPVIITDIEFIEFKNLIAVTIGGAGNQVRFYEASGAFVKSINLPFGALRVVEVAEYKEIGIAAQSAIATFFYSITEESFTNNTFDVQVNLAAFLTPIMFSFLNDKYVFAAAGTYNYLRRDSNLVIEKKSCYDLFNNAKQANKFVVFEIGIHSRTAKQLINTILVPQSNINAETMEYVIQPIVPLNQHTYRDDIVKLPIQNKKIVFDYKMKFKQYRIEAGERVSFQLFYKEFQLWEVINYNTIEKFMNMKFIDFKKPK